MLVDKLIDHNSRRRGIPQFTSESSSRGIATTRRSEREHDSNIAGAMRG